MESFPWPEILKTAIAILRIILEVIGGGAVAVIAGRKLLYTRKEVKFKWQK